jgi:asparagine synthetase B (glutamine-hydrolysing)
VPSIDLDEISNSYFVFGCIKEPASQDLQEKIHSLNQKLIITPINEYGYYFYRLPFYAQETETEQMVWVKLGHFHDREKLLSMGEIIANGWVSSAGIQVDNLEGDGVLLGFNKYRPEFYLYRNLLSASAIHYTIDDEFFIAADNLRILSDFLPKDELNDDAIVQHFIYRQLNGRDTYFKNISSLLVGEMISFDHSGVNVGLAKDFRSLSQPSEQKPVTPESVDWFFSEFKNIIGLYLDGNEACSATMLSGGIDSSLVQAAINTRVNRDSRFPSLSFVIDSPGFAYEVDYA